MGVCLVLVLRSEMMATVTGRAHGYRRSGFMIPSRGEVDAESCRDTITV